jgi:glycosyltransferase involved in cell wall biosynthesis
MACGCVPILPKAGGANEYAVNGHNAFMVDTSDTAAMVRVIEEVISGLHNLADMQKAAIATAQQYSIELSSERTYQLFRHFAQSWHHKNRSWT